MSMATWTDEVSERIIYYDGAWRRKGDYVRYDSANHWKRFVKFQIVYVSNEGCGQIQLPRWYFWMRPSWFLAPDRERLATIIGDTVSPKNDVPLWMNQ